MKYRIQFSAIFNNSSANDILNTLETVKTKVFEPNDSTLIPIQREASKYKYFSEISEEDDVLFSAIDFDAPETTHSGSPSGETDFEIKLDISFDVIQDFYDCINYLETIKNLADNTKKRFCRFFVCNHDENPLIKDGQYTYMDFSSPSVIYPL